MKRSAILIVAVIVALLSFPLTAAARDATMLRVGDVSLNPVAVRTRVASPIFKFPKRRRIPDLALRHRIPTMFFSDAYVRAGGLMSYGVRFTKLFRRAADYVDKIAKGAKPADLPIEQPTKFNLTVNLKTAKAMGITFPPSILLRADKVIE